MIAVYARNHRGSGGIAVAVQALAYRAHHHLRRLAGVVFAKVVLGSPLSRPASRRLRCPVASMNVLNGAFPPLGHQHHRQRRPPISGTNGACCSTTVVTTKLVLTVGVIATAVQLADRLAGSRSRRRPGPAADAVTLLGSASAPTLLLSLSVAHLLMLGAATVISVYKPWGRPGSLGARRAAVAD